MKVNKNQQDEMCTHNQHSIPIKSSTVPLIVAATSMSVEKIEFFLHSLFYVLCCSSCNFGKNKISIETSRPPGSQKASKNYIFCTHQRLILIEKRKKIIT